MLYVEITNYQQSWCVVVFVCTSQTAQHRDSVLQKLVLKPGNEVHIALLTQKKIEMLFCCFCKA